MIPNLITLIRLLACLPLVYCFVAGRYDIVLVIYAAQEILDQLDGKLAKAFGWTTTTGQFFDPFADSLTHLTAFACLITVSFVPLWMYFIFLFREFGLLFLRLLAGLQGVILRGQWAGKLKALTHAVVLLACFWRLSHGSDLLVNPASWISLAVVASVLSGIYYLFLYRSVLKRTFS